MIFAAGLGTRMRPITDTIPKPLLQVKGKALIEYHLQKAKAAGIEEVVINVSHLYQHIIDHCGNGEQYGLKIHYSIEETPLETAGGLAQAASLLGSDAFIILNGDVFIDIDLRAWISKPRKAVELLLVDNPSHHPQGDFGLNPNHDVVLKSDKGHSQLTYAGAAILHTELLDEISNKLSSVDEASLEPSQKLSYFLRLWIQHHKVSGTHFRGTWCDVGTPERLEWIRAKVEPEVDK